MRTHSSLLRTVALLGAVVFATPVLSGDPVSVTSDNFVRAESDMYFSGVVANGGFGKFDHTREPAPLDKQTVIRLNRDTLYSSAVFDLQAGPVSVSLPESDGRFMSMQVFDQDQYTVGVYYDAGTYKFSKNEIGTRYILVAIRTLVDPEDKADLAIVHGLQDSIKVKQKDTGEFEVPQWDRASQAKVRKALLELGALLPDTRAMYGKRSEVDPVRFLIGAALGWGANPETEALYLNVVPRKNDGSTVYSLKVKDVPVDGFWSVSVYNGEGYFEPNPLDSYALNNITASKGEGGGVTIQFGGCDGGTPNCIPIPDNWNYMVRLYRPQLPILNGEWRFPDAEEMPQ